MAKKHYLVQDDSIAVQFHNNLIAIGRNDEGFVNFPAGKEVVASALDAAIETELPFGDGSHDATVELTFNDGSRLRIDNPNQAAFALQWVVLN